MSCIVCKGSNYSKLYYKENSVIVKCACSFIYIPEPNDLIYENLKNEDVAREIRKGNNWLKEQHHLRRIKLIKKYKRDGRLFDLGAGWGHFLSSAVKAGYDGSGIEIGEELYKYAKYDLGLNVSNENIFDIRPQKEYDIITMWDVLEHIKDADIVIDKCSKMLKDDGFIFIQVPQIDSFIARIFKDKWHHITSSHINYFSKNTVTALLKQYGIEVISIRSNIELKHVLVNVILPLIKGKSPDFAGSQEDFNKITNKPVWVLKVMLLAQNILLDVLSFFRIGEEMIVIGRKLD
jgi:2-polyprenyl-3-methyl-5-hydroxy-6-metoxy-1,4-benzoquinol methylase